MAVVTGNLIAEFIGKLAKTGTAPGNNADPTSTWDNVVTAGKDGALSNFAYSTTSGWAGDGTAGNPYRLCLDADATVLTTVAETENGARSYEFWVKAVTANTGILDTKRILFSHAAQWAGQPSFETLESEGRPMFYAGSSNYRYWNPPTIDVDDGNLHHWVVTIPGGAQNDINSCILYIDGVAQGVSGGYAGSAMRAWGTAFRVGSPDTNYPSPLVGIATIRVYSDVLSSAEVTQNRDAGVLASSVDTTGCPKMTDHYSRLRR